ncbi:LexA-binding, inner membrane-associated putative hydrolase [Candidatus Burarchaeum australiense]|nr:LexA-binding, inner membrane-associated putative hydrolase [Candidatus Burarchaeum australiense]
MQTGFKEHLATGLVAVIILLLLSFVFFPRPAPVLAAAVVVFMLGTLLPDVDAPFSIIRRTVNAVLFLLLFLASLALIFMYHEHLLEFCTQATGADTMLCTFGILFLAVAVPAAAVAVLDFLIPFHRGIMHGFLAAFIYGVFISALLFVLASGSLSHANNIFIALAGMLGYVLHIVVDIIGDVLPSSQAK